MRELRIGYVPLSDAAVLIAAAEKGFAEAEGLSLKLEREASWANIRDKLIFGLFDAAHMLAPFTIATSLGLGHVPVPLAAPFALNLNGNAITLSSGLFAELTAAYGRSPETAGETAGALRLVVADRASRDAEQLKFGTVFPFSTHTYLLRHWLRSGGIDPEQDVQLLVVPPPYMVDGLRSGLLHGFCVGSPWNSLAVEASAGRIAALGVEIAAHAPEKVLAVHREFAETDDGALSSLLRGLGAAARWCATPENHEELANIMARSHYLNLSAALILDTLDGTLRVSRERRVSAPDFLKLGQESVNRPDPRHALWLYAEMVHAKQTEYSDEAAERAKAIYRSDLYDSVFGKPATVPSSDPIGLTRGPDFSAAALTAYLAALDVQSSGD